MLLVLLKFTSTVAREMKKRKQYLCRDPGGTKCQAVSIVEKPVKLSKC